MIVKNQTIGFSAEGYKEFFDSFNCPLITSTINGTACNVAIGDNLIFQRDRYGSTAYYVNGTIHSLSGSGTNNQFTVAADSTFAFMLFRSDTSVANAYSVTLLCEVINNRQYYSYLADTGGRYFHAISDLTLIDSINNNNMYKHGSVLNYTANTNLIDYTSEILFDLSNKLSGEIDLNCIACSTVTANQVLTFGLHNYYSIGTNTLVPIDLS